MNQRYITGALDSIVLLNGEVRHVTLIFDPPKWSDQQIKVISEMRTATFGVITFWSYSTFLCQERQLSLSVIECKCELRN